MIFSRVFSCNLKLCLCYTIAMKSHKSSRSKKNLGSGTGRILKRNLIIYAATIFILFALVCLGVYALVGIIKERQDNVRLDRIHQIYRSIDLDDSYRAVKSEIFGDKRVYQWDKGRTYASTVEYGRNATAAETYADLEKRITAAGFAPAGSAYENSVAEQRYYKSQDGEYIRVAIKSGSYQNSLVYGTTLPSAEEINRRDTTPVYVTIKVNLDDNNE